MSDRAPVAPGEGAIVLAAIAGAHGITGEVRLKLFAESVESLRRHVRVTIGDAVLTLRSVREGAHGPVARFAEVTTREAADALRGRTLAVDRAELPPPGEGEVYVVDLIGLTAVANGVVVGRVVAVENYGAGDLIEVEREDGERMLVPFARCLVTPAGIEVDDAFLAD